MSKSETCPAQGEKLEAPVRLTPEQLESVAAGFLIQLPYRGGPIGFPPHGPKGGPMGFAPVKLFS
jgi:hypothetical protein